ncbi:uncharacterized protein EAF02_005916 [Botrytis sinoallii]|uniref:uncharacterized protein n=1 Tax=Botrytis sinoallii TaxID=1463999 RepID=UPI0018FFE478|nr:uncharacterized protein EAF02_005916 [Botrytis sinoallii]KAF7882553.1 hypothetical protein EAF02_005916 [Botrytis sinoallii]
MSGNRRPFKLFSSRGDSNDDLTCPPPYRSTAPTSSQTSGAKPIFDFSNMNTSMDSNSSESPLPSSGSAPKVPRKCFQDIPETEWMNKECRQWLEDYFMTMCGYKEVLAVEKASNFMGSGMSMYMMSLAEWKTLMGVCEGSGIFGVLMEHNRDGKYCFQSYNTRKNGALYY